MVSRQDQRPADGELKRYGNRVYTRIPTAERFWPKVLFIFASGCWEWQGSLIRGYGAFADGAGNHLAHRYAYELLIGPIPDGLTIDHLCRNPRCVNPWHMEPVTIGENIRRAMPYRVPKLPRRECRYGHEFADGSYTVRPDGVFRCKQCVQDRADARGERRRLARIEKFGFDPGPGSRSHLADYYRDLYTGQPRGTKFVS